MNIVDSTIALFSPKLAVERARNRAVEKILKNSQRSYDGATKSRRGDGWTKGGVSVNQNTDIQGALTTLRERSIHGYKNNPSVHKAIRTIKNNVVGTGIMPTPIGVGKKLTKIQLEKVKKEWELFVKSCDFDGMFNFYGLQALSMQTIAMQGEIFVFKQRDAESRVTFRLQILSPHMVDHTVNSYMLTKGSDSYVVQGVQFSSKGKKEGFWIYDYNPNNEYVIKLSPKFVPISDCFQVFYKEFPEQVRGIPFGTSAMLNMRDLSDYEDAQLMLQKVAACHVAFTTQPIDESGALSAERIALEIDHLEPGLIQHLAPGDTVTFNNPPTPSSYSEYVSKNQQKNAAGFGITYEQLTGDMGNVNFSSGRMGWIEAQRQIEDWQYNFFIPQFCDNVWKWFIEGLKIKNIINFDCDADWTPQGREMIDPVKEMNGLILELKSGLVSWTEACKRRGYNPDVLMEQIKTDREVFKLAGIEVDWIVFPEAYADPSNGGDGAGTLSTDDLKRTLDAYGVGVRAGTITPTDKDEEYFRSLAKFPDMSEAVISSWKEDGGFRRPITLAIAKENTDFAQ